MASQTLQSLRAKQPAGSESLDPFDQQFAINLDKQDPLSSYRSLFHIPRSVPGDETSPESIYFCGNSLGLQPKQLGSYIDKELKAWKDLGVEGHFKKDNPWITVEDPLIEPLAHLVGAKSVEVAPMNSLTVDLHILMIHFYKPTKDRFKIIMEGDAFPSDEHAIESQVRLHGFDPAKAIVQIKPRDGEFIIRTEDVKAIIEREGPSLALVLLGGLQFYTGQLFEMEKITKYGHDAGAVVGWDLAHAAGNVPLKLHDWDVDFACWCSYKYLNSGPGTIAGIFVHEKHSLSQQEGGWSPMLAGWFGHELETRFKTGIPFKPMPGALGFRCSNPSVLCITSLRCSLDIFERAGIQNLREKSFLLTGYLELLIDQHLNTSSTHVTVITPRDPAHRGCQLSFLIKQGDNFDVDVAHKKLMERGVICDVRRPNVIRIAPTPLYNTFDEVRRFVIILQEILQETTK